MAFERRSADGEEGYPGNLEVRLEYRLTDDDRMIIAFEAISDRPTHVNLTNHTFWNLAGDGTIHDHRLQIFADRYLETDELLIPTGTIRDVAGGPLDLRRPRRLGEALAAIGDKGFDHCYVLGCAENPEDLAARVSHPASGRAMSIRTSLPGLQCYSGNFLDGSRASAGYPRHAALCLETQFFPDSPNQPAFPSTRLEPGTTWSHTTEHRFAVVD